MNDVPPPYSRHDPHLHDAENIEIPLIGNNAEIKCYNNKYIKNISGIIFSFLTIFNIALFIYLCFNFDSSIRNYSSFISISSFINILNIMFVYCIYFSNINNNDQTTYVILLITNIILYVIGIYYLVVDNSYIFEDSSSFRIFLIIFIEIIMTLVNQIIFVKTFFRK